jgi:hypothetical protein
MTPACHPGRLWSLWEIMNHFKAWQLALCVAKFATYQKAFNVEGHIATDHKTVVNFLEHLDKAAGAFKRSGMREASERMTDIAEHIRSSRSHVAAVLGDKARTAREEIVRQLRKRKFLRVSTDRASYLDKDDLFGPDVTSAFGSASRDIKEAGNCLAAECNTAAVFHLMRAAEFGLRALAMDRKVEFSDKPIEHKEWGQILPSLETVVRQWKDGTVPASRWPDHFIREKQIRFYHEAIQELRSFNEAWRSHVSHADQHAFYDNPQAASIYGHVREFMQKLATRISEHAKTDEFWQS